MNWLCWRRTISYEFDYLSRKFRLVQALIFFLFLVVLVIMSWGDTQSFFIEESSPLPQSWQILKNESSVRIISLAVIIASYVLPWLSVFLASQKDNKDLAVAVEENLIPAIEIELTALKKRLKQRFNLAGDVRISIFIPVRRGFFKWKFQMVCRTPNIRERELLAQFKLDEGVIGYTFLKNRKQHIEYVNVSGSARLPGSYKPLIPENETLIDRRIKAVLVAAVFQEGSVAGLLAIDTDNDTNILKMENNLLHDDALDWIIARSNAVRLLWRMRNNV